MANLTTVTLTSGVPTAGSGTVSTLDNIIGTAGTGSAQVLTVQGNASGTAIPVSIASLPSGAVTNAGTFAVQVTSAPTTAVTGTFWQTTQPVSIATNTPVIAAGTNTIGAVKLTDGTSTAVIKAASTAPATTDPAIVVAISPNSVNANGQATMANSAPVAIASNQASIPVTLTSTTITGTVAATQSGTWSTNLLPSTSGGLSRSRTLIPNNTTAIVVKSGAGQLYKIRGTNNSANIAYIKLYDATSATAGSGTPVDTIMIPAASAGGAGVVDSTDVGVAHATGITYIVTTGIADTDTTAPAASAYIVTMYYK